VGVKEEEEEEEQFCILQWSLLWEVYPLLCHFELVRL